MFGLHGIIAMLSTLTVNTTVSSPIRAAASAASHPAWPAPMTAISIVSSKTAIFLLSSFSIYSFEFCLKLFLLCQNPAVVPCNSIPADLRNLHLLPLFTCTELAENLIHKVLSHRFTDDRAKFLIRIH